jgi:uncharacterized protein
MQCRPGCAACCIAPSISTSFLGYPNGKPAGVPCIHLDDDFRCGIFDDPERPAVCSDFNATEDVCGTNREQALSLLIHMEQATQL